MKSLIVTICLLMLTVGGYAMIETLSLEQLAHGADIVVKGSMAGVKSAGRLPEGPEVMACLFEAGEVLKGEVKAGDKLKIKTFAGVEDMPVFKEGSQYVLFLKKVESHYEVFNGVQGSWEIDQEGRFLGMGHGKTIEQIKAVLDSIPLKQPKFQELTL